MITVDRKSKEVIAKLKCIASRQKENIIEALHEIGEDDSREVVRLIKNTSKTGRIYKSKGRLHRASAPGEAPANLTGKLASSVNYKVRNHQEMRLGESALYAVFLENGTKKMAPRPHLITAINNNAGSTYVTLERAGLI